MRSLHRSRANGRCGFSEILFEPSSLPKGSEWFAQRDLNRVTENFVECKFRCRKVPLRYKLSNFKHNIRISHTRLGHNRVFTHVSSLLYICTKSCVSYLMTIHLFQSFGSYGCIFTPLVEGVYTFYGTIQCNNILLYSIL